ncbi:methyltransferase domain-containing protein [Aerophototrophica crusticola]|uniref:Methyltransferase domain-containing protein n=1 Tax=Aerophototrophica crusticola TaxID=1709002 RepID=A0A858RAT0_9PROT|nr:methyltransferase domain-containing protein [Rhodospirillaceae bacterium B3]
MIPLPKSALAGLALLATAFVSLPAAAEMDAATSAALDQALAGAHRSDANKARDQYRHPKETLTFFGLKQGQTVVEIWPGGGWYTEVLAPVMKGKGTYVAASWDKDSTTDYVQRGLKRYAEKLAATPEAYSEVKVTEFGPKKLAMVPPGSADLVLTFRNVHNWMADDWAEDAFKAMYAALKPGGVLGVVEHRANTDQPQDPKAANGYVRQDHVVKLAEAAGFKLAGTSEVNANPKDTKDHPKGVWTLPPSFALKDQDKDKYAAIGESDRMTLRFVKPAK